MTTDTDTEPDTTDGVTVAWVGDLPRIRAWLDNHGVRYDLSDWGRRGAFEISIQQKLPGRFTPSVAAKIGDRLYLDGDVVQVRKRTPNRRMPPPEPPMDLCDALAEIEAEA